MLDVSEHLGDQPEHGNRRLAAVPVGIAVHDRDQRAERVDLDEQILRRAAGAARLVAAHGVPPSARFQGELVASATSGTKGIAGLPDPDVAAVSIEVRVRHPLHDTGTEDGVFVTLYTTSRTLNPTTGERPLSTNSGTTIPIVYVDEPFSRTSRLSTKCATGYERGRPSVGGWAATRRRRPPPSGRKLAAGRQIGKLRRDGLHQDIVAVLELAQVEVLDRIVRR